MLRPALTLASLLILAPACASHVATPKTEAAAKAKPPQKAAKKADARKAEEVQVDYQAAAEAATEEEAPSASPGVVRKLGDFHVYEYAGAFSKHPIRLTEQVVAQEGEVFVVDFVLEEGSSMSALRVRLKGDNQVVAVARITADGEVPATEKDYEALVAKTALVPDSNDEKVATDHTSCMVGDEQVDCDVTTYNVTLGNKQAKLTISTSSKLPGRDLGGEIKTADGKLLYSARLVERGNQPPVVDSLAKADRLPQTSP